MQMQRIERLLNNGFGMTRLPDGRVLMIPDSLPGEEFRVDDMVRRQGVWWMRSGQRLTTADDRCHPRCIHFDSCGGCQLLHIRPRREMAYKCAMLRDTLQRIARVEIDRITAFDLPWGESRYRGKLHARSNGCLGFVQRQSRQVTSIPHCAVLPKSMLTLLRPLSSGIKATGFAGEIWFACDPETQDVVIQLRGKFPSVKRFFAWIRTELSQEIRGVAATQAATRWRAACGKPFIKPRWNGFSPSISPSQFFQSNPESWTLFFDRVRWFLDDHRPRRVWDVHAGSGFLASCCDDVACLTSEPDTQAYGQLRRLANMRTELKAIKGSAEFILRNHADELREMDGIILDPPRTGLSSEFRQWLCHDGMRHVLYFSCDMATLARDLCGLSAAYHMAAPVVAINANPGTVRLETAVELARKTLCVSRRCESKVR